MQQLVSWGQKQDKAIKVLRNTNGRSLYLFTSTYKPSGDVSFTKLTYSCWFNRKLPFASLENKAEKQDSCAFVFIGCHKNNHAATTSVNDFIGLVVVLYCIVLFQNWIECIKCDNDARKHWISSRCKMHDTRGDTRNRRKLHACHPKHIHVQTFETGGKFTECHMW
jgi:hypothetical protein